MTEINIREVIGSKSEGINAHMLSVDDLCKEFNTNVDAGLTEEQAKENLEKYGPNKMRNMPKSTLVRRDNEWKRINPEELVPGDIVQLQADSNFSGICGDVRIVEIMEPVYIESYFMYKDCFNFLNMNEMTVEQTSEDALETSNLVFNGTSLYHGIFHGIVFQTGENMLLSNVSPDLLDTPALADSDDEEMRKEVKKVIGSKSEGINAHLLSVDDLCKEFNTTFDPRCFLALDMEVKTGLTEEQAKENLKKYGPNKMKNMPEFTKVPRNFGDTWDLKKIKTEDLVPGDIVFPKEYNSENSENFRTNCGDIRILIGDPVVESYFLYKSCRNFRKWMKNEHTEEDPLVTDNLIFHGTTIHTGRCVGMVFQTGENMLLSDVSPALLVTPEDFEEEEREDFEFSEGVDTIEKVCETYNTDVDNGLTAEQVVINQEKSGKNKNYCDVKIQKYTMCKRDGELQPILSKRLTIGDIIELKGPQFVPADIRVVEASEDCKGNRTNLYGEPEPMNVSVESTHDNPLETTNLLFASRKLTSGTCTGIVIRVGKSTCLGRMSY